VSELKASFGGICVTGTIARTATNVRAGARGPTAGMSRAHASISVVREPAFAVR
jgi:SulP family sulfate permease